MNHFYVEHFKKWLRKNNEEEQVLNEQSKDSKKSSETEPEKSKASSKAVSSPDEIAYENQNFRLVVEKGAFKRQKTFKISDHLYYFKVKMKDESSNLPLLMDILDFLHAAFLHILDTIKSFYEEGKAHFMPISLTRTD